MELNPCPTRDFDRTRRRDTYQLKIPSRERRGPGFEPPHPVENQRFPTGCVVLLTPQSAPPTEESLLPAGSSPRPREGPILMGRDKQERPQRVRHGEPDSLRAPLGGLGGEFPRSVIRNGLPESRTRAKSARRWRTSTPVGVQGSWSRVVIRMEPPTMRSESLPVSPRGDPGLLTCPFPATKGQRHPFHPKPAAEGAAASSL